jgi:hypothetical protein
MCAPLQTRRRPEMKKAAEAQSLGRLLPTFSPLSPHFALRQEPGLS